MPARRSGTNVSTTTHSGPNVPILVITGQERVRVRHFFSAARVLETVCRTRRAPTYAGRVASVKYKEAVMDKVWSLAAV